MPIQWNSFGISPIHTWPHLPDFPYQQRKPQSSNSPSKEPFRRNPRPPNRQPLSQPPDLPIQQQLTWPPMAAGHSDRQPGQRRPMCGVCTKPLRVCLCGRLRAPPLDTNVGVTVLQHSMEAQHPLSSIRVARLGLRNLVVTQVTDVNHRACFLLRTLDGEDTGEINDEVFCNLSAEVGRVEGGSDGDECFRWEKMKSDEHHRGFERPVSAMNQLGNFVVNAINGEDQHISETEGTNKVNGDLPHLAIANTSEFHFAAVGDSNGVCNENVEFSTAIGQGWTVKNMDKCSVAYTEKELRIDIERGVKPKIRWLSRGLLGQVAVSNGFVVTKIQKKKSKLTGEVSEFEEFSITIPPHSALLFPCQRAVSIDASDCKVEHLIVLDGTWAKAQRMYHENPWLQLLPHVKLESDRVSLYCEVRHEPRAGCLSTIESIVVAMKKLGEDAKGLDDVLNVFESMIADQRRCKDENCEQKLKSQP